MKSPTTYCVVKVVPAVPVTVAPVCCALPVIGEVVTSLLATIIMFLSSTEDNGEPVSLFVSVPPV